MAEYSTVTVTNAETTLIQSAITQDGQVNIALDLVNLQAGDTFVLRCYLKVDGTNWRQADTFSLSGVQTNPAKVLDAWANANMPFKITMQRTAGADRVVGVRTRTRF